MMMVIIVIINIIIIVIIIIIMMMMIVLIKSNMLNQLNRLICQWNGHWIRMFFVLVVSTPLSTTVMDGARESTPTPPPPLGVRTSSLPTGVRHWPVIIHHLTAPGRRRRSWNVPNEGERLRVVFALVDVSYPGPREK